MCGAELQGKCQKIADAVSSYYGIGRVQCDAAFLQRIKTQQRGDAVGGRHDQTGDGGRLQLQPCGQFGQRCGQQPLYKGEKRQDPGKKRADTAYDRVDFRQGGQPLQQHNTGCFLQHGNAEAEQGQAAHRQRDAVEYRADCITAGLEKQQQHDRYCQNRPGVVQQNQQGDAAQHSGEQAAHRQNQKAEKQSANGSGSFGACQPTQRQRNRTVDRGTEKGRHDQTIIQPGGGFLRDLRGQHGTACIAAQKQ